MKSILLLLAAIGTQACQRDFEHLAHKHRRHVKRTTDSAPAELDANEKILLNSFDNTSISSWSYYYSE